MMITYNHHSCSVIYYPDILPNVCTLSLSMDIQQNCIGAGHRYCFLSSSLVPIFTTTIHHILFCPQDIYDRPCLSNSYDLVQLAFFRSRCPRPPSFSFRSTNGICGKSPYVSNIAGPLCSSGITFSPYLPLHSLVPEVEVTRTVTQSQSDKMHNRRWLQRIRYFWKSQHKKTKVHAMES